eukprot:s2320_g15.t1
MLSPLCTIEAGLPSSGTNARSIWDAPGAIVVRPYFGEGQVEIMPLQFLFAFAFQAFHEALLLSWPGLAAKEAQSVLGCGGS